MLTKEKVLASIKDLPEEFFCGRTLWQNNFFTENWYRFKTIKI